MNNSKTNTVLLVIIIVLLAVGLYMVMSKKGNSIPVVEDSQSLSNEQTDTIPSPTPVVKNTTTTTPAWSKVSEESGMSIMVPEGYTTNTNVPGALLGHGVVLNVTYHNKNVLSITKFSTQNLYNDSAPHGMASDYILVNSSYSIGGTTGLYYNRQGGSDNLIAVPSKLVLVQVEPTSFSGISQVTLDKMLASIQL